MRTYRRSLMDSAKSLKLRDLALPESRKSYTSSLAQEEVDAQKLPGGLEIRGGLRIATECELYTEEGEVLRGEMCTCGIARDLGHLWVEAQM